MPIGEACPTPFGIQYVIRLSADADNALGPLRKRLGCAQRITDHRTAVHATGLHRHASHAHDFRRIAPHHRRQSRLQEKLNAYVSVRRGACAHRVQHHRNTSLGGRDQRQPHTLDPIRIQRANIEYQRLGNTHHVSHFLVGMRHHRGSAARQQRVGVEIDDHQIRDVVHQWGALAHGDHIGPKISKRKFCGHVIPKLVRHGPDRRQRKKLPSAGTTQIRFKEYVSVTRRRHL